jgi:NAD(P)-dependent dehydrogenase (short-subunit alcohol dehydrogenase family)
MKVVVITGGARGFGLEMAKEFRKNSYDVVILDVNKDALYDAEVELSKIKSKKEVISLVCDITNEKDVNTVIDTVNNKFNRIDIWINNAGVNQSDKYIWDVETSEIEKLIKIDLIGTMICSSKISKYMINQKSGSIYNVEGHGSNDATIDKLTVYGTAKRGVTYFTESLAHELKPYNITVGKITPGIMITNFIYHSLGDGKELTIDDKTKKIYNILGDYPETIVDYVVPRMIENTKNDKQILWLTNRRAFGRFLTAGFKKRDFFAEK